MFSKIVPKSYPTTYLIIDNEIQFEKRGRLFFSQISIHFSFMEQLRIKFIRLNNYTTEFTKRITR